MQIYKKTRHEEFHRLRNDLCDNFTKKFGDEKSNC